MIYNSKMEAYLNGASVKSETTNDESITILQGYNSVGEPYFYLEDNCLGLNENSKTERSKDKLTELEWTCNETYISGSIDVGSLFQTGLAKVKSIEAVLKAKYPSYSFDIVMSIDDGVEFGLSPSVTIWLYCIRDNEYYVDHSELQGFSEPILIETIIP